MPLKLQPSGVIGPRQLQQILSLYVEPNRVFYLHAQRSLESKSKSKLRRGKKNEPTQSLLRLH